MSQYKESVDIDISGRVMYLEQRTKGLQGRISAIETRLSGCAGNDSCPAQAVDVDAEFVPATGYINDGSMPGTFDAGHSGMGQRPEPGPRHIGRQPLTINRLDATGLLAGGLLIGVGLLLYAGNLDIIKNPILSLGCGLLLIMFSVLRSILL